MRSYISGQVEHHRERSFQEELEQLFEKHGIKPDPRFWERSEKPFAPQRGSVIWLSLPRVPSSLRDSVTRG